MREQTLEEISQIISTAEPGLALDTIREVVAAALPKHPPAKRLLALLRTEPDLLISASSTMPRALDRLIGALLDRGAEHLQRPQCGHCGARHPLSSRDGTSRICYSCAARAARAARADQRPVACHDCGRHAPAKATVLDRSYCRGCWARTTASALDRIAAVTRRYLAEEGGLAGTNGSRNDLEAVIADAVVAGVGGSPKRARLALELEQLGAIWFADPAQGNKLFGVLYDALHQAGLPLPRRRCGRCGREAALPGVIDGRRCCRRCQRHGMRAVCDGCGELASLERREPDGTRYCQRCTNTFPDESAICIVCGIHRLISHRAATGPVCGSCRGRELVDTCTRCGRFGSCRFAGTAHAVCEPCAVKREACHHCGRVRTVHSRTSGGRAVCPGCAPPVIETCTGCGRARRVAGRGNAAAYCGHCYSKNPVSFRDCRRCGRHAYLTAERLCDRCDAHDKITTLLPDTLIATRPPLRNLRDTCLAADPATVRGVFRRKRSTTILQTLLAAPDAIDHAALDALDTPQATRAVRSLLVEHGVLPARDEHLARLETWVEHACARISDPTERRAFVSFARWRHLRHLRSRQTPTSYGQAASRRRELRLIIDLLVWARQNATSLSTLTQDDLDRWRAGGATDRYQVKAFLRWTNRNGYSRRFELTHVWNSSVTAAGIGEDKRWQLLRHVLDTDRATASTRFAAALLLLYGVRLHRIATITVTDVTRVDGLIHVTLGSEPLVLPDQLDPLAVAALDDRGAARLFHTAQDTHWLFPGTNAGQPISADTLTDRVATLGISAINARRTALASLAMQLPPVIIARLTGLDVATASRWADAVSASNARYAAVSGSAGRHQPGG